MSLLWREWMTIFAVLLSRAEVVMSRLPDKEEPQDEDL
jgi:hypothetical protein